MIRPGARQGTSYGMALRAAAALSFSLMYALMKWAATLEPVSAGEMVFYRSLFGLPVVLMWVLSAKGGLASISTRRPMVHVWRCVLGVTGILLIFQGLRLLPLADATTIGFTAPIFATLLSILFLKEKVGRHRWTAVILGFLGVLVMVRPGAAGAPPLAGLLFALGGAFVAASVTVTLRQLGRTESATAIVFWFFVACATVGGALALIDGHSHSWAVLGILAAGGLAGGLAQLLMTTSLQHAPVSALAPLDYLQMVGAVVLGWLLLSDVPTLATLSGAA
ncbi:DMT family transporter, partial [Brevundimonas sp. M-11_2]